jgi:hypothetical protein
VTPDTTSCNRYKLFILSTKYICVFCMFLQ